MNVGEGVEKKEASCTVGDVSHYGEQYDGSFKKRKIELSYDPKILLLSMYLDKTMIQKDI